MTMRLIDAEALVEKIKEKIDVFERDLLLDKGSWLSSIRLVWFKQLFIMVEAIPTIEAKPVVHAHWENKKYYIECSNCKEFALMDGMEEQHRSKYCPHCGAQMDEFASDNNVGSKTEGVEIPIMSMEDICRKIMCDR